MKHDFPILEALGGAALGLPMLWLFAKRMAVKLASDELSINSVNSQTQVIDMLRDEVERLGGINGRLSASLNELHIENIKLRKEISDLHETVNRMSEKLNSLSRQTEST